MQGQYFSPETLVTIYRITRYNNTQGHSMNLQQTENLKSKRSLQAEYGPNP